MKPIDIKGRPIFSHVFTILQQYGVKLSGLGWKESGNKPNLFYKEYCGIMVFADMRGTEIIPIWQEPYPYIYASGQSEEDWKRRRAINKALENLDRVAIPHRFSFYEECEPDGLFFGDKAELADGKCKFCGKEFDHDGLFCSDKCEKDQSKLQEMRQKEAQAEIECSISKKAEGKSEKEQNNPRRNKFRKN